jgi:hypothetical protein
MLKSTRLGVFVYFFDAWGEGIGIILLLGIQSSKYKHRAMFQ